MVTEDDLQATLDSDPDDWGARLTLADWYEENGDSFRAAGQRWQVKKRRYPLFITPLEDFYEDDGWTWVQYERQQGHRKWLHYLLPGCLMFNLGAQWHSRMGNIDELMIAQPWENRRLAEDALARALFRREREVADEKRARLSYARACAAGEMLPPLSLTPWGDPKT